MSSSLPLEQLAVALDGDRPSSEVLVADTRRPFPDVCETVTNRLYVRAVLRELSVRERQVLVLRYGLLDGHCCTRSEVSHALGGLSTTSIAKIERQALRRALERMELRTGGLRWWGWDLWRNYADDDERLLLLSGLQRAHGGVRRLELAAAA